jgi:hypothetical protein
MVNYALAISGTVWRGLYALALCFRRAAALGGAVWYCVLDPTLAHSEGAEHEKTNRSLVSSSSVEESVTVCVPNGTLFPL